MNISAEELRWAFVTPSYIGDLERCELLCRSMDRFLTGPWHHYIVVDRPHFAAFKHLAGARRSVWLTEDVAPSGMRLLFNLPFVGGRSVWWSRETGLSLGWHLQQMIKIGIAEKLSEEGLAYCDSDMFFLRPFNVAQLQNERRIRLFRSFERANLTSVANPEYVKACIDILRLSPQQNGYYAYVDNFVTWHRPTVLDLCRHLAELNGGKWHRVLRNRLRFSEYALYGMFVDEVQKTNGAVFPTNQHHCKTHWSRKSLSREEVEAFCANLRPDEVSVGIQSFAGVKVELLAEQFEKAAAFYP
jgi:hypothetical protein